MMWQQGNYMPGQDSGVHSGVTTQAPSLSGKEQDQDMDTTLFDLDAGYPQGYTHDQVNGEPSLHQQGLDFVFGRGLVEYPAFSSLGMSDRLRGR